MWSEALSAVALTAQPTQMPRIEAVEVREFDPKSGRWVASSRFKSDFFNGWNWRFFDRDGSNDDLEVVFTITGAPASILDVPLTAKVSSGGKVIDERRYTKLHISETGKVFQLLHLRDLACSGNVDVTASLGVQTRSMTLGMECGE